MRELEIVKFGITVDVLEQPQGTNDENEAKLNILGKLALFLDS